MVMSKFTKSLEEKAELLASAPKREQWDKSIPSIIRREIALTVDQIKRLKEMEISSFGSLILHHKKDAVAIFLANAVSGGYAIFKLLNLATGLLFADITLNE